MSPKGWLAALVLLCTGASAAPAPWTVEELSVLRTLWIRDATLPPTASNRYADDPAAAALGRALFFDPRFSANGQVSCASCHDPERGFADHTATGHGVGIGSRRTMPIRPAIYSDWQFWDGRADSLWSQALGPVENPVEHGFTRTEVLAVLRAGYRNEYEAVFGPLPVIPEVGGASPSGDAQARANWDRMPPGAKNEVNRAYANFGKAIAAYERTLTLRPTRFDDYLASLFGEPRSASMTADEVAGLRLFIGKGRCLQCHNGPLLSNGGFANTGVPVTAVDDDGRLSGVRLALSDPFNCHGPYSDAPEDCQELDFAVRDDPAQRRAFKVPSLRGAAQRPPYMHAGQFRTLEEVVDHYDRAPTAPLGTTEIRPVDFTPSERRQIVAFLETLNDRS